MFLADDTDALSDPTPKVMGEVVTARQLAMIRERDTRPGVDAESECRKYFNCGPEELSRRAAAALIEHLTRVAEAAARQTAI